MDTKPESNVEKPLFHTPKTIYVSKSWVWPTRILFWLAGGFFLSESYYGYIEETIFVHRNYWSLSEEPFMYWFCIISYVVITSGCIWQSCRVKIKT